MECTHAVALQLRRANSLGSARQCLEQPDQSSQSPACPYYPSLFTIYSFNYLFVEEKKQQQNFGISIQINGLQLKLFYYCAMLCIARTVPSQDVCLSVRLSVVCLSHAGTVSKQLNVFSNVVHRRNATPF